MGVDRDSAKIKGNKPGDKNEMEHKSLEDTKK